MKTNTTPLRARIVHDYDTTENDYDYQVDFIYELIEDILNGPTLIEDPNHQQEYDNLKHMATCANMITPDNDMLDDMIELVMKNFIYLVRIDADNKGLISNPSKMPTHIADTLENYAHSQDTLSLDRTDELLKISKFAKEPHKEKIANKIFAVYEALRDLSEIATEHEDFNTTISNHNLDMPFDYSLDELANDWYAFWVEMTELL